MNISLIDVDGHNFPNLALMKISAWHKMKGDKIEFHKPLFSKPDICYGSKIFTFTPDYDYYPDCEIIKGGTGYNIKGKLNDEIDKMIPDYNLYNCENSYGYLTRGCPRKCDDCFVPEKEGDIKPYMDIEEIVKDKKSAVLMDNNVLASDHGLSQIEKIIRLKIKVDFNQGLDARLINNETAKLLSKVKWLSPLRMACDHKFMIPIITKAANLLRKYNCTPKNYFMYVLVKKDINDAHERAEACKKLNIDPYAQPHRDKKNTPISREQKDFCRWVNHKAIFKTVKWADYK